MQDRKFICPCYRHEQDIARDGHCICHLFVDDTYQPIAVESPADLDGDAGWPRIVLYGALWCHDTLQTRRFLHRHGVPYTLIDVDDDDAAAKRVLAWNDGCLSTPTLDVDGRIVTEPTDEELAELLGLD